MNSAKVVRISTIVIAVFMIVYVVCQLFRFDGDNYATQTVYEQTVYESIPVEGILFREETVIPVGKNGIMSCNYSVGEKVSTKTKLGSLYQNQKAIDTERELKNIENTLGTLEKIQGQSDSVDIVKPEILNNAIGEYGDRLILARENENFADLFEIRAGLTEAYAKRDVLLNGEADYTENINNLKSQRDSLKSSLGTSEKAFYSTAAGYFVDHIDGGESVFTEEYLYTLKASEIKNYIENYEGYKADDSSVKVVKDHNWFYVTVVPEEKANNLKTGNKAELSFPNQKSTVSVTVKSVEFDEETKAYKVIFRGDTVNDFLLSTRVQSAKVMITPHKGIKVPKKALRFKDDEMGVYIKTMNKIYFRKIDKLYEGDDFIISKTYFNNTDGYLELYDDVIVKGKDLYDGKPLV